MLVALIGLMVFVIGAILGLNVGAFGAHHVPVDQMRSWIQNKIRRDDKIVTRCIEELGRSGLIQRSSGNTIYAVHGKLDEIIGYIDTHLR